MRPHLRSGAISDVGGAAILAGLVAAFPLALALAGVGGISWPTAFISAAILAVACFVAALAIVKGVRRRIERHEPERG